MCGKCPIAALPDQIYERLSNDNEHPFTSLDEIAGLPRAAALDEPGGATLAHHVSLRTVRQRGSDSVVDPAGKKGP